MIGGVVLAGGESRRMNKPKALLRIREKTFAECIIGKMEDCGVRPIVIAAGAHYQDIRNALGTVRNLVVENKNWREGQLASLQEGLRHLPDECEAVLVWPVDQPLAQVNTVKTLLQTFEKMRNPVTLPLYQSRRGHPVVYSRQGIEAILSMDAKRQTAKELLEVFEGQVSYAVVDDMGVIQDIDTPEDYRTFISSV